MALWDGHRRGYFSQADGLSAQETKVTREDADGSLWMGRSDGVTWIPDPEVDAIRSDCLTRGRP